MKTPGGTHRLLLAGIALATIVLLWLTYHRVPLYTTFYTYEVKSTGSIPVKLLLVSCFCALAFAVFRERLSAWIFVVIAVAAGTAMQFGFAYTEGRGFDGIRARALAGHGQFIVAALASDDALGTVRNYESLSERGKLGVFPRTKPPGTLLFYILTERVSRFVVAHTYDEKKRLDRFVDFLATVWPFVATLAIIPIYWLTTLLAGPAEARLAAGLYLLVPSANLVTLHTDQVLFPFLFTSVLALFVWSMRAKPGAALAARGAVTGVALWVATFCDFPLAVASVLCVGLWLAAFFADQRPLPERIRSAAVLAGSVIAGVLVPTLVLWMITAYDPIVRWRAALAIHANWRKAPAILGWEAGLSNLAEFIDWTGIPISMLALAIFWVRRADRSASGERPSMPQMALMASLMCVAGYLAFFSRTVAEIGRLWLFLMPVMCIVAARTLSGVRKSQRAVAFVVLALQFATVYVIKVSHDFW